MVGDDPESFADLDGHTMTQTYQLANPAASSAWDPMGADSMSDMSGLTPEAATMMAVEAAVELQQKQAQAQNQQTLVVTPNRKKDIVYGPYALSEDVQYTVASMDSRGKTTPVKSDEAKIELDEKLVGGNPKTRICNPGECVSKGSLPDTMAVTASGGGHSVEKRFQLDGKPIKIYDATTKKAYDYVRIDASVKKGFVFTFRNDQPQP
jgi:hypothetical protein